MHWRKNEPVMQRIDDERLSGGSSGGSVDELGDIQARLRNIAAVRKDVPRHHSLTGLLFAHPAAEAFTEHIKPRLDYWHYRSGDRFDFLTVGYSHNRHVFDDELFAASVRWLSNRCGWDYSGSTDLVLLNASRGTDGKLNLDTNWVVAVSLEAAVEDGLARGIPQYMERICSFADNYDGDDPTWGFSDAEGKRLGASGLKAILIHCLPEALRKDARAAFHVRVREYKSKAA